MQLPTKTNNCQELNEDDPEFIKLVGYGTQAGLDQDKAKQYAWDHLTRQKCGKPAKTNQPDVWQHPAENVSERSEGRGPVTTEPTSSVTTCTSVPISQGRIRSKISKKAIREDRPAIYINKELYNCNQLTLREQVCVGLLNDQMNNSRKYAFVTNKQLAHYLRVSEQTVKNMLHKLIETGFIRHEGFDADGRRKLVVCEKWRNPPKKKKTEPIPF